MFVEVESVELVEDFGFEAVALGKHFGELGAVISHTAIELVFGNINIFNLDVEILTGRQ